MLLIEDVNKYIGYHLPTDIAEAIVNTQYFNDHPRCFMYVDLD